MGCPGENTGRRIPSMRAVRPVSEGSGKTGEVQWVTSSPPSMNRCLMGTLGESWARRDLRITLARACLKHNRDERNQRCARRWLF